MLKETVDVQLVKQTTKTSVSVVANFPQQLDFVFP